MKSNRKLICSIWSSFDIIAVCPLLPLPPPPPPSQPFVRIGQCEQSHVWLNFKVVLHENIKERKNIKYKTIHARAYIHYILLYTGKQFSCFFFFFFFLVLLLFLQLLNHLCMNYKRDDVDGVEKQTHCSHTISVYTMKTALAKCEWEASNEHEHTQHTSVACHTVYCIPRL